MKLFQALISTAALAALATASPQAESPPKVTISNPNGITSTFEVYGFCQGFGGLPPAESVIDSVVIQADSGVECGLYESASCDGQPGVTIVIPTSGFDEDYLGIRCYLL